MSFTVQSCVVLVLNDPSLGLPPVNTQGVVTGFNTITPGGVWVEFEDMVVECDPEWLALVL